MSLPAYEILGHGSRRWRVGIFILPLNAFKAAVGATFAASGGRLPAAFWDDGVRGIYLRMDRSHDRRVRDLKHELLHAFNDWIESAYPDPAD